MPIVVERKDQAARHVLIGMIMSRTILSQVSDRWTGDGLFAAPWENLVGGWCVTHFRKRGEAPQGGIAHYFLAWSESGRDRETVQAVESFLSGLAEEYARMKAGMSPEHLVDVAADLFERVRLKEVFDKGNAYLSVGRLDDARRLVETTRKIELGVGAGVDPLKDESVWDAAFARQGPDLVELPGSVGNFFRGTLKRGAFVAGFGKEKIGKSFWVQKLTWEAVTQGVNVAYFELGDDVQEDVLLRFAAQACRKPVEPCDYEVPLEIIPPPDAKSYLATVRSKWVNEPDGLSKEEAFAEMRRVRERHGDRWRLSCHPAGSLSIAGVESILDGWERDGWYADVVCLDYIDKCAPLDRKVDKREQVNQTWTAARALTQRRPVLLFTVSQVAATAYEAVTLTRREFSESHLKYAEVTALFGINQTDREKEMNVQRLNWLARRRGPYTEKRFVFCATCLPIGNPCVESTF